MGTIIGWGVGLSIIACVIAATAAVARSKPRKGGFGLMAAMLFGFGAALDPPQRHVAEAKSEKPKGSPETGEPNRDD